MKSYHFLVLAFWIFLFGAGFRGHFPKNSGIGMAVSALTLSATATSLIISIVVLKDELKKKRKKADVGRRTRKLFDRQRMLDNPPLRRKFYADY